MKLFQTSLSALIKAETQGLAEVTKPSKQLISNKVLQKGRVSVNNSSLCIITFKQKVDKKKIARLTGI